MFSSLFYCQSEEGNYLPLSNGYLLFSALSRHFTLYPGQDILHEQETGGLFTLSALMPDSFWKKPGWTFKKDIALEKGALFAFRISFQEDRAFEFFSSNIVGARLTLGGASFKVLRAFPREENELCQQISLEELKSVPPYSGISVDFLLPAGFKSSDKQNIFPTSELFFGSLALRWQRWAKTGEAFDQTLFSSVLIEQFSLSSVAVRLKNDQIFRGCIGNVCYSFRNLSETGKRFLSLLAALAPFCGVGYKVTQGMGLVKIRFR
jgi:CRISPR-associated endoribonuclease Cas6